MYHCWLSLRWINWTLVGTYKVLLYSSYITRYRKTQDGDENTLTFGGAIVCEPRYVESIYLGARSDGLAASA